MSGGMYMTQVTRAVGGLSKPLPTNAFSFDVVARFYLAHALDSRRLSRNSGHVVRRRRERHPASGHTIQDQEQEEGLGGGSGLITSVMIGPIWA